MHERKHLLKKIQICDFALTDCALFLDTHPYDECALEYYTQHKEMRDRLAAEYSEKFGPLTQGDYRCGKWEWCEGPWPWQM